MLGSMTRTILLVGMAGSLLWAAGFGCGDDAPERRPSEMLAGWQGPPPRININVTGPDSDDDKRERCSRIARDNGIMVDPMAPVQGTLILADSGNRLSISANGMMVREDPKPGWSMDQLCNDAILQLLSVARSANQGAGGGGFIPVQAATVVLAGPAADEGKRERCNRVISQMGGSLDPNVAIRAVLTLAESGNSLQVISARRGVVFNAPKPGWGMEQLCQDAMQAAQSFLAQDAASAPPPPAYGQPPPAYGQPAPGYAPPPQPRGHGWAVTVAGPESDDDKREDCRKIVMRMGGTEPGLAQVTALLYLKDDGNALQITSRSRGIVQNQPKPGWSMERLCKDAAMNAQMAWQQEASMGQSAPPPMQSAPPPAAPAAAPPGTIAVSPMPASPGAPRNVADLAQRGLADFGRRDYANALVAFAEASRTSGDPAMLFDTGLCYYMLNRPQEALQHLQLYVDRAPQAANRPQADALLADLHRRMGNE
jgi:hypothetical protein